MNLQKSALEIEAIERGPDAGNRRLRKEAAVKRTPKTHLRAEEEQAVNQIFGGDYRVLQRSISGRGRGVCEGEQILVANVIINRVKQGISKTITDMVLWIQIFRQ